MSVKITHSLSVCLTLCLLWSCDDGTSSNQAGAITAGVEVAGEPMAGEEPVAGEPIAGEPIAGEPIAGEPIAGEPVAGEPIAGEPVAGEPIAGEPLIEPPPEPPPEPMPAPAYAITIEEVEQREGDPELGYDHFINSPFVGCGFPTSIFDQLNVSSLYPVIGLPSESLYLEGRTGENAELPYFLTHNVTDSGVSVAGLNCMNCHASPLNNELVVGLGNTSLKTTNDVGVFARGMSRFFSDPAELEALNEWADRMSAVGPEVVLDTTGVVAADNMAVPLFGRRDPTTFEWQPDYQVTLPEGGLPTVPLAVPPLWRMGKKAAMFYAGGFRGDHTRFMFAASSLCVNSVEELLEIDSYFHHVRTWIAQLTPPAWPYELDEARVERGEELFVTVCSSCHGTYARDREQRYLDRYPNLLIPIENVNTDPLLLSFEEGFVEAFTPWLAQTPLGDSNWIEATPGYVAPPLDGIWATAPYLHNDSVPSLMTLLKSSERPTYWVRLTRSSADLDTTAVGWPYSVAEEGREAGAGPELYDTTRLGYYNTGHTYGDGLTDEERLDLIEYLKTL